MRAGRAVRLTLGDFADETVHFTSNFNGTATVVTAINDADLILIRNVPPGKANYLQRAMQTELSAPWDKMREEGYRGSFLMVHNSGGSGDIFKTPASRTFRPTL